MTSETKINETMVTETIMNVDWNNDEWAYSYVHDNTVLTTKLVYKQFFRIQPEVCLDNMIQEKKKQTYVNNVVTRPM